MPQEPKFLRYASPNERRTIAREDLGHYHAVIIAGIYNIPTSFLPSADTSSEEFLYAPLQACIAAHPFLSVVVQDKHTEKPYYQLVSQIDLTEHVEHAKFPLLPRANFPDEQPDAPSRETIKDNIEVLFRRDLDRPFREGIPPWRVVLAALAPSSTGSLASASSSHPRSYLVAFEYSHAIGDGPSGVAFHRTFLSALKKSMLYHTATTNRIANPEPEQLLESAPTNKTGIIVKPCGITLPQAFDTPQRLRISWGFLLGPLLGAILPSFIANLLGLKAQASSTDGGTWTGTPCFFDAEQGAQSRVVLVLIPSEDVSRAIKEARRHGVKLTGVVHCLVVRALGRALRTYGENGKGKGMMGQITNFVGTTAINMRGAVGIPSSEMGEYASGVYTAFPVHVGSLREEPDEEVRAAGLSEDEWAAAREATLKFADAATRLQDQPIGLLRYVPNIRSWIQGKLDKERDATYEASNLGCVDFGNMDASATQGEAEAEVGIENLFFAQPGHVTSHAINFNIVTTKTGGMAVCITWPTGSLGLEGDDEEEEKFARSVGDDLARQFKKF